MGRNLEEDLMKRIRNTSPQDRWKIVQGKCVCVLVVFFWLGGCGLWDSYLDPEYQSTRADRLCHPYGQCSQGTWVAVDGTTRNVEEVRRQCRQEVDQHYGNGWWKDSVARGIAIGSCMEKKGYTLQQ